MSVRPESWWFRATANHCLPFRPPTDARRGGSWNPNRTILVDTDSEWRNVAHQSVAAETSPYHSRSHYTGRREKQALRSAVVSCQASSGERFGFFFVSRKREVCFSVRPNPIIINSYIHTTNNVTTASFLLAQRLPHRPDPPADGETLVVVNTTPAASASTHHVVARPPMPLCAKRRRGRKLFFRG